MSEEVNVNLHVHFNEGQLNIIERIAKTIMKTQADLDAAITALPGQVQTAVEAALAPVIQAIKDKAAAQSIDFSSEVASLSSVGPNVANQIATDLTPAATVPPTPGPSSVPPPAPTP